ncbi:cytosine deaminase [Verminephrobacter eiseniae]|uniref:amidohydrolase family protein n=1 Tax=Verminephrobacter eiseniae TaxID=364317 RepID=UPI002237991D|nr:amidohydrolase family protein [Verminephrobacter eiseniae]MCW5261418.1 cytosine deaminase [Verminephrobacter eiseniae]
MTGDQVIRNVRPLGAAAVDIVLHRATIGAIVPAGSAAADIPCLLDGGARLLLPGLVESHVHFDKTLWGMAWHSNTSGPGLSDKVANERRVLRAIDVPLAERAGPLIEHCIARGSLYFRCHIDIDPELKLERVHAMLALRERYRDVIDMQFVAFPQAGMLIQPGTLELMRAALELGVEHVGGLDPAGMDGDPIRHLEGIFALATRYDRGIDIHLHDRGSLGLWQVERIADFTKACGRSGRVMISHAFCLGMLPTEQLLPLADRLAELGISIMTSGNAGIDVPPVAVLRSRGVNVCSGSDGIRDPWSPMGSGDMLERAMLIALRYRWNKDQELAMAFDIVSAGGARALGIANYGLEVGCPANFVLVPAENPSEALINRPAMRTVISRGRIVARAGQFAGQQ